MTTEIERKWVLLRPPAPELLSGGGERVRQGYLAQDGDVEVRVRITPNRASVTVKGGRGISRTEVDAAIGADEAEGLWPLTDGRRIEKVRHRVPVDGGVAEVDVYEGALAGLHTVEVEFSSLEAASAFVVPLWFGPEVTGDPAWGNASLAVHGAPALPAAGG